MYYNDTERYQSNVVQLAVRTLFSLTLVCLQFAFYFLYCQVIFSCAQLCDIKCTVCSIVVIDLFKFFTTNSTIYGQIEGTFKIWNLFWSLIVKNVKIFCCKCYGKITSKLNSIYVMCLDVIVACKQWHFFYIFVKMVRFLTFQTTSFFAYICSDYVASVAYLCAVQNSACRVFVLVLVRTSTNVQT